MRLERGRLLLAFVPAVLAIAGTAGVLLFVALPGALADAYPAQTAGSAVDVHRVGARAVLVAAGARLLAAALLNGGLGMLSTGRV